MSVLQGAVLSRTNDPHVPRCALKALAATAREKWLTGRVLRAYWASVGPLLGSRARVDPQLAGALTAPALDARGWGSDPDRALAERWGDQIGDNWASISKTGSWIPGNLMGIT